MGFDVDCVLEPGSVPIKLFCPICTQLVSIDDAQGSACGHIFCQPCISYLIHGSKACPLDDFIIKWRHVKVLRKSDPRLYGFLENIPVRCLFHRSGCPWRGNVAACEEEHIATCIFGTCPVQCNRCRQQMAHRDIQEHTRTCNEEAPDYSREMPHQYLNRDIEQVGPVYSHHHRGNNWQTLNGSHEIYESGCRAERVPGLVIPPPDPILPHELENLQPPPPNPMPGIIQLGSSEPSNHSFSPDDDGMPSEEMAPRQRRPRHRQRRFHAPRRNRHRQNRGGHIMEPEIGKRHRVVQSTPGWCRLCGIDCKTAYGLDLHSQSREHQVQALRWVDEIERCSLENNP